MRGLSVQLVRQAQLGQLETLDLQGLLVRLGLRDQQVTLVLRVQLVQQGPQGLLVQLARLGQLVHS